MANRDAVPFQPVPPYQEWPDRARRRVAPGVLFGVTVWRLLIVVFAIVGFSLAMRDAAGSDALAALSQQASLLAAIGYGFLLVFPVLSGGRRHEPDTPWLRGALTVLLSLVSLTFLTMLGGDLSRPWSLFEHVLTPALVALDWLLVGRDQRNARWWYPVSWLAFPLAYLLFYIAYVGNGPPIYPFLDPSASDFLGVVFEFLGGVLVFGFVVYGLGKLHSRGRT
jgi:cytochrome bd-type quinol oxidase subunit 2